MPRLQVEETRQVEENGGVVITPEQVKEILEEAMYCRSSEDADRAANFNFAAIIQLCEAYLAGVEAHGYYFSELRNGDLWLSKDGGEGMGLSKKTLDKIWKDWF